jgi:hypothetical protein
MPHDQLFKELLRTFFREFLELFFPEVATRLRFDNVHFLEQEVFTDFPEGDPRRADTIAEVETITGEPEIVLFHVEVEANRRTEFRYRMWEYYALIRLRTRRPVYPIVLYLAPGTGGIVREEYTETLFDENILTFRYAAIGLPDLAADNYRESDNIVGVALSATMRQSSVGPVLQKWQAILRILSSEVDESRKILLSNIVENYLPLSGSQAEDFEEIVRQNTPEEVVEMLSIYEERGIEKGIQRGIAQGIEQGILRGQRAMTLTLLKAKFGEISQAVIDRVEQMQEEELLTLGENLLKAESLKELGLE